MKSYLKKVKRTISNQLLSKKGKRHQMVGDPTFWKMKQDFQINFLKGQGLKPNQKLMDIGCGTLRGGIPLINYLEEGNYYGVEVREKVLNEGRKELQEEKLEDKKPVLIHFNDFNELNLEEEFDVMFAFSVLIHLSDDICEKCFQFVGRHLADSGSFFANVNTVPRKEGNWQGFPVVSRPLDFYKTLAHQAGLKMSEVGQLANLGHVSNKGLSDKQVMLRFEKK